MARRSAQPVYIGLPLNLDTDAKEKLLDKLRKLVKKEDDAALDVAWPGCSFGELEVNACADHAVLQRFHDLLAQCEAPKNTLQTLTRHIKLMQQEAGAAKPTTTRTLVSSLRKWLFTSKYRWIRALDPQDNGVMYAVLGVEYHCEDRHRSPEYAEIELAFNTHSGYSNDSITLRLDESTRGKTIEQILAWRGFAVVTEADMAVYEKYHARYLEYRQKNTAQVWARGFATEMGNRSWWFRSKDINLAPTGQPTKAILALSENFDAAESRRLDQVLAMAYTDRDSENPTVKLKVPTHPLLPIFSLVRHEYYWINVANIKAYEYDKGLAEKLVLPGSHVRLLNALVKDLELFIENDERSRVMEAKAQSRVILLKGPPGTGKTLTSEVYAEMIERPLYEVACGQLGGDAESIEENLGLILARSLKLNAPLVLNEADVFVKKRGNDLLQNSIITVFLRALEYHTGLVFLTTNRPDDIDDALLSRCIAVIEVKEPAEPERVRLWQVLTKEFDAQMPLDIAKKAARLFPKTVGRDIQQLIMLTRRVGLAHKEKVNLRALADCAVFRSIEVDPAVHKELFGDEHASAP